MSLYSRIFNNLISSEVLKARLKNLYKLDPLTGTDKVKIPIEEADRLFDLINCTIDIPSKLYILNQVAADFTKSVVEIEGEVDLKLVEAMINDLGYDYKGEIK